MTGEERQLRAWMRTVFRRAALRWLDREIDRQQVIAVGELEEVMTWHSDSQDVRKGSQEEHWEMSMWLLDCLPRLTRRQHFVMAALYQGMTSAEIADKLQCTPRTVRRMVARIRIACPL